MAAPPRTTNLGDRRLNRIGLGTNRLTDTAENRSFLESAVAAGVNHIDSAHLYGGGESEATVGAALAPFSNDLAVATKAGYHSGDPQRLKAEIERSLERLRVDTITLHYLHRVDSEVPLEDSLGVLAEYREAGRIQHVGLSNVGVEQVELGQAVVPIDAVQNHYSLAEREHDDLVDYCAERELLFVPYFPLRGHDPAAVREIADRRGASPQQVKLAWLLRRSPTILPIPGTLSLEHLKQNLDALDVELSDDEFAGLSEA